MKETVTKQCLNCGQDFTRDASRIRYDPLKYCCGECYWAHKKSPEMRVKRFWENVDKTPGFGPWGNCWRWTGWCSKAGYGGFGKDYAHRFAYEIHNGVSPDDLHVLHHCDNPPCVNPEHCFLGTHQDNMADATAKGRMGRGGVVAKLRRRQMLHKLFGLTHRVDGTAITRQVTTCKVGIGLPQGKDIHVYIDGKGQWVVKVGKEKITRVETKQEARKLYFEESKTAPERKYPGKIQYFTFTRISADGNYQPDFEMIELNGPLPTEIPIIFFKPDPLEAEYAYFTSLEKKCWGDGKDATRITTLYTTEEQAEDATAAEEAGERYYKIEDGCWTMGCPFAKPYTQDGKAYAAPCKPHGRLFFQFLKAPSLGASAYFDTTGRRSISQLFSCLQDFREFTGRGDVEKGYVAGIPLWLTVRPYRATFMQGGVKKTSTQYGVGIEFRGEGIEPERLVESLISRSEAFQARTAARQLTDGDYEPRRAAIEEPDGGGPIVDMSMEDFIEVVEEQEVIIPESPEQIASEFYPEGPEPEHSEEVSPEPEAERKTPQRKKKETAAAPAEMVQAVKDVFDPELPVTPIDPDKVRIHCNELVEGLAQKGYNGNIFDLVAEEGNGARKVKDVPVEKLLAVEARLTAELKKL